MIDLPMVSLFEKLPEIAKVETRAITIPKNNRIPEGKYGFLESYCDEENCDCRRVFINVYSEKSLEILATISYGWESKTFYKNWYKGIEGSILEEMVTPFLAVFCRQSKYAKDFLKIFEVILEDKKYVDRLKRHYFLFKEIVDPKHFKAGKYSKGTIIITA